jgi:hypothetical protein
MPFRPDQGLADFDATNRRTLAKLLSIGIGGGTLAVRISSSPHQPAVVVLVTGRVVLSGRYDLGARLNCFAIRGRFCPCDSDPVIRWRGGPLVSLSLYTAPECHYQAPIAAFAFAFWRLSSGQQRLSHLRSQPTRNLSPSVADRSRPPSPFHKTPGPLPLQSPKQRSPTSPASPLHGGILMAPPVSST